MTRRELLQLTGGLFAASAAFGQSAYPGVNYRLYPRCLPDYLRFLARQSYELRNTALAGLNDAGAIRRRQEWARKTFWRLIGGEPERTPLNARVTGGFEREGYRVEKVVYQSQPGFFVTANLYVPTRGKPPYPGVLYQLGHIQTGKSAPIYQKCCQGLAQLGYVVLAFDPLGQGERLFYDYGNANTEHHVPGRQMLLAGDSSTRLMVWDSVRGLDYLAAHPLVDASRLGSTGNSGGASMTMMLAAVDDRLTAAALSCPNSENLACAEFNPPGSVDDAEQNIVDGGPEGFGRWDTVYPFAPKPLLFLVSAHDYIGIYSHNYLSNGWEEYCKLREVYGAMDATDRLRWQDTPFAHSMTRELRMEVYNWFGKWLQGNDEPVREEPPVKPEAAQDLQVTPEGNVVRGFGGESPFTLNRGRAAAIKTPAAPSDLAGLLRVDMPPGDLAPSVLGRVALERVDAEAIEVPSAEKVWVPAWLFLPREKDPDKPLLFALEPAGRRSRWREDELYQELAAAGWVVCLADRRGLGNLRPECPRGATLPVQYHPDEETWAWASMMLGKPLLGQRVTDVLALVTAMANYPATAGRRIVIAARDASTVPALFTAALDERVSRLYLSGGLESYRSIVETKDYSHPFANFVPDVLRQTDLPQVAAAVAPRPVTVAGVVNGAGKKMRNDDVRRVYGMAGNVSVLPDADWSIEGIGRWGEVR